MRHVDAADERVEHRTRKTCPCVGRRFAGARHEIVERLIGPARLFGFPPRGECGVWRFGRPCRRPHLARVVVGVRHVIHGVADACACGVQSRPRHFLQRLHRLGDDLRFFRNFDGGVRPPAVRAPQRFGDLFVVSAADDRLLDASLMELVAERGLPVTRQCAPLGLNVVAAAFVRAVEKTPNDLSRFLEPASGLDFLQQVISDRRVSQRVGAVLLGVLGQAVGHLFRGRDERIGLAAGAHLLGAVGDLLQDLLRLAVRHAAALDDLRHAIAERIEVQFHIPAPVRHSPA